MADNSPQVFDCERLNITVLLVDDDTNSLSIIAGFLRSWQYKVATAASGHEALKTLKEFRGFFDLVIADMNMRGMNGLELQKHVKCEFNLPVIIMSTDRRKSVMRRSLDHGAAYCIAKPIQREDLKDVWQYAVAGGRQKLRVQNDKVVSVSEEEEEGDLSSATANNRNVASCSQDLALLKNQRKKYCKRKRSEVVENEELIFCGPKRSKIFWTTDLHNRFLLAINHIGMDKAVPTKILEIMNVPGLTRENVASHLQKYRMFLKKVADKGIIEGLSERALRSRFAMGLPTDLIKDLKRRVSQFRQHENYYHQPYNSTIMSRPRTTTKPLWNQTIPLLSNQNKMAQPNHYGTNHTYKNFQQQSPFHNQPIHHRPIANNGGYMTSTNALTASGNLMSNYASLGNNRKFNYLPTNYGSYNNLGMVTPYRGSGLQRSPSAYNYNNHHATLLDNNNNRGMIVPFYGSSGLHQSTASTYNNHHGTQLNNNASLILDAPNRIQNVDYSNNYNRSSSSIFGLLSNGSASNNALVPASSSGVNVCVEEPNPANIYVGLPSMSQKSVNNGVRINAGGGNHDQNNTITSVNQRDEAGQMDDFNELFLMLNDMVLPDEVVSNQTTESPHADERSSSDILSSFNAEDYIELFQGDGDHVNTQTSERSINVLPNNSSSWTNENLNMVMGNDVYTNLEPLDMFMADSSTGNTKQDLNMDLIEELLFGATDPN